MSLSFEKIINTTKRRAQTIPFDRIKFLSFLILFWAIVIVYRLFTLQVVGYNFYQALAAGQHEIEKTLLPRRGNIYVKEDQFRDDIYPLATTKELYLVYAVPKNIKKPKNVIKLVAEVLELDELEVANKILKEDDPYEPLKRRVSEDVIKQIDELELTGIGYVKEKWRYYPEGTLVSHILGFVNNGLHKGQYGIEGYFEEILAGKSGFLSTEQDEEGRWIALSDKTIQEAEDGDDLILTIDRSIQYFSCKELKDYVERFNAESGLVIVLNPKTGAVIAMCSYPTYDINKYWEVSDSSIYNNPAIFDAYEPGSIFKAITMAGAIDRNVLSPTSTYVDEGFVEIGKHTIKNSDGKAYGIQTMTEVLEKSLNTGTIFIANELGYKHFKEYVYDFGFGKQTGIELTGEVAGNLSSLDKKSDIYLATASFGQGITTTPLQMASSFAVIANGGKLMQPYIIDEIIDSSGNRLKKQPVFVKQVISPRTASLVGGMLVSVIKNGHAKTAAVDGYYIAGKTGTAQYAEGNGYADKTIHSFVGFGPVDHPEFVILTRIKKPEIEFAVASAAPLFQRIAQYILDYKNIPRDF